jgi:predicted ATPase/class 3 adenylate cyclase
MMGPVTRDLPAGTVTFLFTDIEGSTKLLHELGPEGYTEALAEHRRVLREAFARHGGVEVDTQGDAFFCAFPTAQGAVDASREGQEALLAGPIRVRIGVHTGTPHQGPEGYVGEDVHKGARIAAAAHGGQVVLSKETRDLIEAEVTDLGEHRVKDFEQPVWIFQQGSERFPPLKTISNTNLPRPASSFVGREREVAEVVARLRDGARLLTLSGPGGSGKTRLAIEAASELVPEHRNGVFWVELAALRDPALVTEEVAETVGAKDGLAEHIGERDMLLVLDNLEQVIEAAPDLASVVESCPNLRLLVTSRELLRVRGEVEYPVPPLADPEAAELFCSRSGVEPDEDVAELCRRLDNLPLAVELAAARTRVLTPVQILERLSGRLDLLKGGRDADPRQATLRATIEWSHDLLTEEEQALFARLSVFSGGATLEAAEEVARADLDALQSLVDKSLLRRTGERFWMLETIREYAAERLEATGDATEVGRRHAEHFLALAEEAEPHLFSTASGPWLDRLEREHDNLRAALAWFESTEDTQSVLALAGALAEFWGVKGHLAEGRRRLEAALRADDRPTPARAKSLNGASDLALGTGDVAASRRRAEEGLALNRTLGRTWGTADSLLLLGGALANEGDFAGARQHLEEGVHLFRELGDEHNTMEATRLLAWACGGLGDIDRATALLEENLRRARAVGDPHIEATALEQLAGYAIDQGLIEDAVPMVEEAFRLNRDLGDAFRIPLVLSRFAQILAIERRLEAAARVLSSATALMQESGAAPTWIAKRNEETLVAVRDGLDDAAVAQAWDQGRNLTAEAAVGLALDALS